MDYVIDTIEGRLQLRLGQQAFEIEALKQQLSQAYKEIEDLRGARLKENDTEVN